jgi:DNA excision repair protein ERCC-3
VTAEPLSRDREAGRYLAVRIDATRFRVDPGQHGVLKQALTAAGFPAEDLAGNASGEPFPIALRESSGFVLRDYQRQAAEVLYLAGSARGGSGVVVLPCGAGKTIVGMAAMELVGEQHSC